MGRRSTTARATVPDPEAVAVWQALNQWTRRFGRAVDESPEDATADEKACFTLLMCDMLALGSRRAEGDPLSAEERVRRFTEQLGRSPWPWRDNPHGYRTFLDSAEAFVARAEF